MSAGVRGWANIDRALYEIIYNKYLLESVGWCEALVCRRTRRMECEVLARF